MRFVLCALLVCSAGFMSVAQQDTPKQGRKREPSPGTLHSIAVKGNRLYSSAAIIKDSGLKIGQRVTGPIIEQARAKLQSTELFNNVADEFRFSGDPPTYDLTFEVAENDQVFPMRFERLGVSTDAVQQYLQNHVELYADRIPGTQGVLKRYTAAVQDFVGQTNPSMEVRARVSNDDPKQLAILFAPAT